MRDRRVLAAALWLVLAFLVWNVRFDYGVRVTARSYLNHRALYLRGAEPRIEMASVMRAGIHDSAGRGDRACDPLYWRGPGPCGLAIAPIQRMSQT